MKGIRTRCRNFLEKEIQNATAILRSDFESARMELLIESVGKCVAKLQTYTEKVETQTEKLCSALDEGESEFMENILEQDSQLCAEATECCIDLKQLKTKLNEKKETDLDSSKSSVKTDPEQLADMQSLILNQMKHQQEFLEQQQIKLKEQESKNALEKASSVKLPKIDIASYSGDRLKWNEFWDSFECTVHINSNLSNIEKFSYLKSKLSGEAARAVSGLALSNENYAVAIATLRERFGNSQEVIDCHYNEMINLQTANNNTHSLRLFLDKVQRHLRSLEVLKQNINQDVFVSMIKAKLPQAVLLQLEIMNGAKNKWSTVKLIETLCDYIFAREKSEIKSNQVESNSNSAGANHKATNNHERSRGNKRADFQSKNDKRAPFQVSSAEALVAGTKEVSVKPYFDKCRYCENKHWSDECPTYRTVKERKQQLKDSCFKCLKTGHLAKECKRSKVCVHCGEVNAHHRSLCPKKFKQVTNNTPQEVNVLTEQSNVREENALISSGAFVLMQTATTEIRNPKNANCETVRLLLDSGSQRTYITEKLAEKLKLKKTGEQELRLATFGTESPKVIRTASTEIRLKLNNGKYLNLSANIVPTISGTIQRKSLKISSDYLEHLMKSVELADSFPSEDESSNIELLVGNDFYLDIVLSQRIEINPGLYLLGSKLGWILTGRTNDDNPDICESSLLILTYGNNVSKTNVFTSIDRVLPTKPDLEDFWNVEGIGIMDSPTSSDDELALQQFHESLKFEDGRYQVTWPWKEENPELPVNRELAVGRLKSVVSKLRKQPELLQKYHSVLEDQLKKGVIETIEDRGGGTLKHYLPHHAVVNFSKLTTKLRIVYDASAKTRSSNKSLNECLYRGPVLLKNLCGILMRFRLHRTALVADIEKAFLQIGLQRSQRDVTRFLWLKDIDSPRMDCDNIQEYRFCRVPFGVVSSPFLLGATVENHLSSYHTELANKLKDDIYVDNVVSGTDTVGDAMLFYNGAKAMFSEASMNLREWVSNSDEVNRLIPPEDKTNTETTKLLGHIWNVGNDTLSIKQINVQTQLQHPTKRNILKSVASIFDPQGLVSPIVLRGKLLLKTLWSKGLGWDDEIPQEDSNEWSNIQLDIRNLPEFQLPRCVKMNSDGNLKHKLLCFCDASSSAYAAGVYLHQTTNIGSKTDLLFTKTRLTPVKGLTIPRAELMAVLIGIRCLEFVKAQLKLPVEETYLWTDSQCVLKWIFTDKDLTTFVRNRVTEIKSHKNIKFRFTSTKDNPADIATRGCSLKKLSNNDLWWHGPKWLESQDEQWSETKLKMNDGVMSDF
ncbi:MAG: DUF1759 domain-containing protein [Candidatus Thiodiazotropha taylori]|nr:DUF1759 domain-containing protein [Candidatus Thiodiazotropha taylori]MCW4336264.1 DUF1759 domain-containing protein [Candidatus Thiodiazotropha endolucinida]